MEEPQKAAGAAVPNYGEWFEVQQKIDYITRSMKEIAELPSEKPKDVEPLKQVVFGDEGGVLTYMGEHPYPYKGFPWGDVVEKMDIVKKVSKGILGGFYHSTNKRSWLQKIFLLPCMWIFKDLIYAEVYAFHRFVGRFRLKPLRYCTAIRELHRAYSYEQPGEDPQTRDLRLKFRDLLCMHLEYDNAYRYRFQDLFPELNKDLLVKNPIKELTRMFDIAIEREILQEIKDTWTLTKLYLNYYLRFDKRVRKSLVGVLCQIDPELIKLDDGDKHFCEKRVDYKFKYKNGKM